MCPPTPLPPTSANAGGGGWRQLCTGWTGSRGLGRQGSCSRQGWVHTYFRAMLKGLEMMGLRPMGSVLYTTSGRAVRREPAWGHGESAKLVACGEGVDIGSCFWEAGSGRFSWSGIGSSCWRLSSSCLIASRLCNQHHSVNGVDRHPSTHQVDKHHMKYAQTSTILSTSLAQTTASARRVHQHHDTHRPAPLQAPAWPAPQQVPTGFTSTMRSTLFPHRRASSSATRPPKDSPSKYTGLSSSPPASLASS